MKYPLRKSAVLVAGLLVAGAAFAGQSLAAGGDEPDAACENPADVLDLANWKLTLPTGEDEEPTEITQPDLATFAEDPWFVPLEDCTGVQFRSAVNGVTTGGSSNPRSELREMNEGGGDEAAWSSSEGKHTMVVKEAFTAVPNDKPHVVGAQIHGGDDDFTVFRLEDEKLWITDKDETHGTLADEKYVLGTPFEAKFVVENGVTEVYYDGKLVTSYEEDYDGAYFKAGAYTQANCDSPSDPCDETNYGEVIIYDISVTHE